MFGRALSIGCLGALAFVVSYCVIRYGGGGPVDWSFSLLVLGLSALVFRISATQDPAFSRVERIAIWAALLFPAYVAFQLVPLPLFLLRIVSPVRAEIADALGGVMPASSFAPLSIAPPTTWIFLSRIAAYAVVFLLIRETARRSAAHLWVVAVPLIGIGGLEAAYGLSEEFAGARVISGTYLNKDQFAGLLESILPFALMYGMALLYPRQKRGVSSAASVIKACGVLCVAVGIFFAITSSFSRMGFVSTLVSLFVMGALALGSRLSGWKKWSALAGLAALILLVFVFAPPNQLIEAFGNIPSEQITEGRWPIWRDTLRLIAAYPLFGCGLGNYYPALMPYQTSGLNVAWVNAHNDYLELVSELGIVGFLIPATLMFAVCARAMRAVVSGINCEVRFLALACAGGLAAVLIHSLADFNLYVPANAMVLAWISGLSVSLPVSVRQPSCERSVPSAAFIRRFALTLGCFVFVYSVGFLIFLHVFRSDPKAERTFCHFGICDTDTALASLQLLNGGTTLAALPQSDLLEFLRRDPAGTYRWEDLGEAMEKAGHTGPARYCFRRALVLAPRIPYTLYRAADFHLGLRENRKGLELMTRTWEADPGYEQTIFRDYDQKRIAVGEILRYGLPGGHAYQGYLRFLIGLEKTTDAEKAWDWIIAHRYADDKLANDYVQFLVGKKEYEAAQEAWACYAGGRENGYPESNRVFNGDFESDPTESHFDWRIEKYPGATIDFDREVRYSGVRSLRIQFDGTQNVSKIGISQTVFLKPGRYRFEAYVRARDISTDEGLAFRVANEEAANRLSFTTKPVLGSTDWTLVEHPLTVPPTGSGIVKLQLVRTPSLRFDNLIRGTFWIDQVSISRNPRQSD
jgi:putative inorganic carbon (hco3(-)) transporter